MIGMLSAFDGECRRRLSIQDMINVGVEGRSDQINGWKVIVENRADAVNKLDVARTYSGVIWKRTRQIDVEYFVGFQRRIADDVNVDRQCLIGRASKAERSGGSCVVAVCRGCSSVDRHEIDIYAAFDKCCEKMEKQLRRYKRRLKDHHR